MPRYSHYIYTIYRPRPLPRHLPLFTHQISSICGQPKSLLMCAQPFVCVCVCVPDSRRVLRVLCACACVWPPLIIGHIGGQTKGGSPALSPTKSNANIMNLSADTHKNNWNTFHLIWFWLRFILMPKTHFSSHPPILPSCHPCSLYLGSHFVFYWLAAFLTDGKSGPGQGNIFGIVFALCKRSLALTPSVCAG